MIRGPTHLVTPKRQTRNKIWTYSCDSESLIKLTFCVPRDT